MTVYNLDYWINCIVFRTSLKFHSLGGRYVQLSVCVLFLSEISEEFYRIPHIRSNSDSYTITNSAVQVMGITEVCQLDFRPGEDQPRLWFWNTIRSCHGFRWCFLPSTVTKLFQWSFIWNWNYYFNMNTIYLAMQYRQRTVWKLCSDPLRVLLGNFHDEKLEVIFSII